VRTNIRTHEKSGRYNKIMVITNLLLGDEGHIPNDRFTGGVPDPENVVERPI